MTLFLWWCLWTWWLIVVAGWFLLCTILDKSNVIKVGHCPMSFLLNNDLTSLLGTFACLLTVGVLYPYWAFAYTICPIRMWGSEFDSRLVLSIFVVWFHLFLNYLVSSVLLDCLWLYAFHCLLIFMNCMVPSQPIHCYIYYSWWLFYSFFILNWF